jgi:hypothetical protein
MSTKQDDDVLYFAWVLREQSKTDQPDFMPVIYREGVAPSGITKVFAKWELKSTEQFMSLDQLREIYPLKG